MAIKPVSGEVKSQDINDNLSYLDVRLNQISGGPLGVLNSETELKSKYPNGANGFFLINNNMWFWEGSLWVNKGAYPVQGIADGSITEDKMGFPALSGKIINVYNKTLGVSDAYIDYTNGNVTRGASGYRTTEFIDVIPGQKLYIEPIINQQCAYYDKSFSYKQGIASYKSEEIVPEGCYKIRLTLRENIKDVFMINVDKKSNIYFPFGTLLEVDKILNLESKVLEIVKDKVQITVRRDGTGDFVSPVKALESIKDASESKKYIVLVYEGIYDIWSNYTAAQINNTGFRVPFVPDNVDILGIGDNTKIVFDGKLDSSFSAATQERVSPLHLNSLSQLHNFTIIGQNTRYSLHPDFNVKGTLSKILLNRMRIIKLTGGGLRPALGAGCLEGAEYSFTDCYFESEMGTPFSLHNNRSFKIASVWNLTNCTFRNGSSQTGRFGHSLELLSEGSGTKDIVNIIGCDMPDGIFNASHTSDMYGLNTEGSIDLDISGYGNTIAPNAIKNSDGKQYTINFNEETIQFKTEENLKRGDAVKISKKGYVSKMTSTDPVFLFKGFVAKDSTEFVDIRVSGYIESSLLGLSKTVIGSRIGISDGRATIIDTNEYVAISDIEDFVLIKW